MSDFKAANLTFDLNGVEYGAVFTLNVVDSLQSKYNKPIDDVLKMVSDSVTCVSATKALIAAMINEWVDIQKDNGVTSFNYVTENFVGRYLDITTFLNEGALDDVISASLPEDDGSKSPNPQTVQVKS